MHATYRARVLLVELFPMNGHFYIVLDVGHSWEVAERWGKGSFDVVSDGLSGESTCCQCRFVAHEAVRGRAEVVERDLECEGVLITSWRQ